MKQVSFIYACLSDILQWFYGCSVAGTAVVVASGGRRKPLVMSTMSGLTHLPEGFDGIVIFLFEA